MGNRVANTLLPYTTPTIPNSAPVPKAPVAAIPPTAGAAAKRGTGEGTDRGAGERPNPNPNPNPNLYPYHFLRVRLSPKFLAWYSQTKNDPLLGAVGAATSCPPKTSAPLRLVHNGLVFDEKEAAWWLAATPWEDTDLPPSLLEQYLPRGVVSKNARRVGVWPPITRAFACRPLKLATEGIDIAYGVYKASSSSGWDYLLGGGGVDAGAGTTSPAAKKAEVDAIADLHLATLDLRNDLFACSCQAYIGSTQPQGERQNWRRRHILCKHLIHLIYSTSGALIERSKLSRDAKDEWKACRSSILLLPDGREKEILLSNYTYYFLKHVFAPMGLKGADYNPDDAGAVAKIVLR